MPRVDGEEDPLVDLDQRLEIAEYKALRTKGTPDERSARLEADQLKEQIARLRNAGKRSVIELDEDHPDLAHLD